MPTAAASNDHQRVLATRWWFPRLPCALHRHQRVTTTRWWLPWLPCALHRHQRVTTTRWWLPPPPSDHHPLCPPLPPLTTTNESSRLVGGFLGFHVPSTATNESQRLVGGFLGFDSAAKSLSWTPEG